MAYFNFDGNQKSYRGPPQGQGMISGANPEVYAPAWDVPNLQQHQQNLQGVADQYGGLLDLLNVQARGEGPSIAQDQLRQATDRNISQAMALGASQAGYQPAAATQRAILDQTGQMNQEQAMQSGILRAQEMLAGRQALSDALAQQAGIYGQAAGLDITQAGMNQALQNLLSGNFNTQSQLATQAQIGAASNAAAMKAADKSLIGSIFSDVRLKTDIVESEPDLHEFLDSLGGV